METIDGRQRPAAVIRTLLCNPSQPLQFQRDSGLHTGTIVLYLAACTVDLQPEPE
jgi:hypothetical protein